MKEKKTYYEELISRHLSGDLSNAEKKEFQEQMSGNKEFIELFRNYKSIWQISKEVAYKKNLDVDAAIDSFLQNTSTDISEIKGAKKKEKKIIKRHLHLIRIAALIVITLGLSVIFKLYILTNNYTKLTTSNVICKENTLTDGSLVHLNKQSTIRIPEKFNKRTREIYLEGEAYFEIKNKANHPFIVHTENIDIKVLGTSFNVNAYSDSSCLSVNVDEGTVSVFNTNNNQECIVTEGESVIYNKKSDKLIKNENNNINHNSWKTNIIIFDNTNLFEATQVIERLYSIKFKFAQDSLKKCNLTAEFKNDSLNEVIEVLSGVFETEIINEGGFYIIGKE